MSIQCQALNQRKDNAVARGVAVLCDFYVDRAKNAELWDIDGKRYIDFAGGIGVLNTGHLNARVKAAVEAQLEKFSHTCFQIVPYELYIRVAEKLNRLAPGAEPKKTAFFTIGAEAVENAIKIAKAATGRSAVIALQGAFHGRTHLTMGLTAKISPHKQNFGPFPPDIYRALYPNLLHGISVEDALKSLDILFKTDVEPNRVAAIIVEPVQGEGGFNIAPFDYLRKLRACCDQHGILLISDEIQAGFARTGKFFSIEHAKVVPDMIVTAKSLAGGLTLSAVVGKAAVMDGPHPGGLGGTYAGHPLALAAADAVIDVIEQEKLCERSCLLGQQLMEKLNEIKRTVPAMRDVRGLGSMVAIEFMRPNTHEPDAVFAKKVQTHALANGLIVINAGLHYNIMRCLFPLTIEQAIFEEALAKLEAALRS